MREHDSPGRACANDGCSRVTPPGETLCESCALERELFRRDTRESSNARSVTDRQPFPPSSDRMAG